MEGNAFSYFILRQTVYGLITIELHTKKKKKSSREKEFSPKKAKKRSFHFGYYIPAIEMLSHAFGSISAMDVYIEQMKSQFG